MQQLLLLVSCPAAVNCTNASVFLTDGFCEDGPLPNETNVASDWIVDEPSIIIESPLRYKSEGSIRMPFAYDIHLRGDTLFAITPYMRTVHTFDRSEPGLPTWAASPSAAYSFPDEPMWMAPVQPFDGKLVALGDEAMITQFEYFDLLPVSQDLPDQLVVLLPRGAGWGTEGQIALRGPSDKAGFGYSAALSGGLAAVASRYSLPFSASEAGTVALFERSTEGIWGENGTADAVAVIGAGYESILDFGHVLALDEGSAASAGAGPPTLLVGAPGAGAVYVFERGSSAWSTTASAQLVEPPGGAAAGFPSGLALSGAYALVSGSEAAWLYTRSSGVSWTAPPVELVGDVASGMGFAASLAVQDLGFGRAVAVLGAPGERRALLFERDEASGAWTRRDLTVASSPFAPAGFGRAVAVGAAEVVVGSDDKKIFIYSQQELYLPETRTQAVLLEDLDRGGADAQQLVARLDGSKLSVGVPHIVCIDFADGISDIITLGDDEANSTHTAEGFRDVGLRVTLAWAPHRNLAKDEL